MDLMETIRSRRSIRHYKADPVDDNQVQAVLEAAHWAPSWNNSQCWRFIVVRDARVKSEVAGTLAKVLVDTEWVDNAAASSIRQAPVLIVVCAEKGKAGYSAEGAPLTDKADHWYLFDVALAMENLVLAAHAQGLGTVIVGGFDAFKVEKILSVPPGWTAVTMTPLGVADHKGQVSPRKPLKNVIYQDRYGQ